MLDAFIIEEIKRRDRGQIREDRPVLELPIPQPIGPAHHDDGPRDGPRDDDRAPREDERGPRDDDRGRGVVIIDYSG